MTPHDFAEALMVYCFITRASPTSTGRTAAHNTDVGGVAYSAHRFWLAADVEYDEPVPLAVRVETARRLGLRLLNETDHDHLQPLTWEHS